jgi:hypothetical protein
MRADAWFSFLFLGILGLYFILLCGAGGRILTHLHESPSSIVWICM